MLRAENERRFAEVKADIAETDNKIANLGVKMTDRMLYIGIGTVSLILGAAGAIIGAFAALR